MSALQQKNAEKYLLSLLHHLAPTCSGRARFVFQFRGIWEHIEVRLKARLSSLLNKLLACWQWYLLVNACRNKIPIKITRFMGQGKMSFYLLEHMSEPNGSIHSQGCNKTSDETRWGLSCRVLEEVQLFFYFSLLLQSVLKTFFSEINCKEKCHGENTLKWKYFEELDLWRKTYFENCIWNFLFYYFISFVPYSICYFMRDEIKW